MAGGLLMNPKMIYPALGLIVLFCWLFIGRAFSDKPSSAVPETRQVAITDAHPALAPKKTKAPALAAAKKIKASPQDNPKPQPADKFHAPQMIAIPGKIMMYTAGCE